MICYMFMKTGEELHHVILCPNFLFECYTILFFPKPLQKKYESESHVVMQFI